MATLKGRVRKTDRGYIWESQQDGCKECRELDGKVFESQDDIPDRPHPNCKCEIETMAEPAPSASDSKEKEEEENMPERDKFARMLRLLQKTMGSPTGYSTPVNTISQEALLYKHFIDNGTNATKNILPLTNEFWKMASEDFKKSQDFINKNGKIYKNKRDLVRDQNLQRYEPVIRKKIYSQFKIQDCYGVYFHQNSQVAKAISNSKDFNIFINHNADKLNNGEILRNKSIEFKWNNPDLYNAFHRVDVLEAKLNTKNEVEILILDTYDFNKNSTNVLVQKARTVQDAGMLTPYYTITKVVTPI